MAEGEPNDEPQPEGMPSGTSRDSGEIPRRRFLTPEQRRLLGAGRSRSDRARPAEPAGPTPTVDAVSGSGEVERSAATGHSILPKEEATTGFATSGESRPAARPASIMSADQKSFRIFEMQKVAIIIGSLILLGAVFYVGTKITYWRYLYRSHQMEKQEQSVPDRFQGVSSDDLVEQAFVAQSAGRWQEAGERFLAAKRKNNLYRGIFLRVGMICMQHGDLDAADNLFAKAIEFGENVDSANLYRSQIALRRQDYAAAERFAEAAAMAAPFAWTNYYHWAEALRTNHHPREAISRYDQAGRRTPPGLNVTACAYKARLARIEARDQKIGEEIARRQSAGSLPVEWLVTEAALKIDQGHFGDALQLLTEARDATSPDTFSFYVSDMIFQNAAKNDPTLTAICRSDTPFPAPSSTP